MEWSNGTTDDDIWIFGLNGLAYHLASFFEYRRDDILIANTYIFEVERSGMTSRTTP